MLEFTQIGYLEEPLQKCLEIAAEEPLRPCLFVGSSDTEVDAFVALAAEFRFIRPAEDVVCNGMKCKSKRAHMTHLLSDGKNVAIKGSLFNYCDDALLKVIRYNGYTLISVGDSIFWSDRIKKYIPANVDEAIRRKQLIPVAQDTFVMSPAHKAEYVLGMMGISEHTYNDRLLIRLTAYKTAAMYWTPQPQIVDAFRSIRIVHCLPAASPLAAYLRIFGVQPKIEECGRQRNSELASLLGIVLDEKYNAKGTDSAAFSTRWYMRNEGMAAEVFKDMRNVLIHTPSGGEKSALVAYAMPNDILSAMEDDMVRPVFRGRGFLAIPEAECEDYSSARVLCYCANTHFPVAGAGYLRNNGAALDGDAYSLCHMLRWISRSAVRIGEPVTVYVPSKRMRGLLENWIEEQGVSD